jgi:hypothetical protein
MDNKKKGIGIFIAAILVISVFVTSVSAGDIIIEDSTLWTGTAPSEGVITYDANSEACPPILPSIGSILGESTGADGSFYASSPMILPGGTYNYINYTVINTTVNYTSSVTILTTGDVLIDNGSVFTSNSSITIVSGGDIILIKGADIYTDDSPGASGSITLEAAGSINLQRGDVRSGNGGETSGEVILKAFGSSSVTLSDNSYVVSGDAVSGDSGNIELWTGGNMDLDDSHVWSGDSVNGATGYLFLYALGGGFSRLSDHLWSGDGPMGTGDISILATGPINSIDSHLWTGNADQGDSGGFSLTSVVGHTTVSESHVWTGNALGTSGSILIQDFDPPPEGGEISVVSSSYMWTGNADAVSGDITFLTGFNPCRAVQAPTLVPTLTPIGLIALVSLLSVIAAMSIKIRKRRG